MNWIKSSPERAEFVIEEISNGSAPQISFYILLLTSALIASFGLLADNTAEVIGAMLVSPLMTSIMGIALALVRGDSKLLGRAILVEALGVALAIGVSALFGLLPLAIKATPSGLHLGSRNGG